MKPFIGDFVLTDITENGRINLRHETALHHVLSSNLAHAWLLHSHELAQVTEHLFDIRHIL